MASIQISMVCSLATNIHVHVRKSPTPIMCCYWPVACGAYYYRSRGDIKDHVPQLLKC